MPVKHTILMNFYAGINLRGVNTKNILFFSEQIEKMSITWNVMRNRIKF